MFINNYCSNLSQDFVGLILLLFFKWNSATIPSLKLNRRSGYEEDEKLRYVLRLVDKYGLHELQQMSEGYVNRLSHGGANHSFGDSKAEEKFDMTSLGRFDPDEFLKKHKTDKILLIEKSLTELMVAVNGVNAK